MTMDNQIEDRERIAELEALLAAVRSEIKQRSFSLNHPNWSDCLFCSGEWQDNYPEQHNKDCIVTKIEKVQNGE